jgi:hypothetical protein
MPYAAELLTAPSKASEIFNNPREAYEKALRDHGPVIAVWRKGFVCSVGLFITANSWTICIARVHRGRDFVSDSSYF